MGIKNLNQFLRKVCPEVFKDTHLLEYAYKKIAVDTALYVCDLKMRCGDRLAEAYVEFVVKLRENKIHPVFVFDGESPVEKDQERAARSRKKEVQYIRIEQLENDLTLYETRKIISPFLKELNAKVKTPKLLTPTFNYNAVKQHIKKLRANILSVDEADFNLLKKVLGFFNVPIVTAEGEAEILCTQLAKQGLVDAVLSSDTDVLAACAPEMISLSKGSITKVCISSVLKALDLTPESWLDFCIMCGTDFNLNIKNIGPHKAYDLIKEHKSIDNLPMDITILNHVRTRELFTLEEYTEPIGFCGELKFDDFTRWVFTVGIKVSPSMIKRRLAPVLVVKTV